MNYPLVKVKWWDAVRDVHVWTDIQEILDELEEAPPVIITVGYLVKETTSYVYIVQTVSESVLKGENDEVAHAFLIPKGCLVGPIMTLHEHG